MYNILSIKEEVMKKFIVFIIIIILALGVGAVLIKNAIDEKQQAITSPALSTVISSEVLSPSQSPEPTATTTQQEEVKTTLVSFAGDCTLGSQRNTWSKSNSFITVVGKNYSYPFAKVKSVFSKDDMTLVNFESVLTDYNVPASKQFTFRASPEKVNILVQGSVEAVNLANNHTMDYGQTGYADTLKALKDKGIVYTGDGEITTYTTDEGVKIGMVGYKFTHSSATFASNVQKLKDMGCDIIIFSMHWGAEGYYEPVEIQIQMAEAAIDAGADFVVGHHPHVLEKIDTYKGKYILYSMGNFCFGGNTNPSDKDTAIVQAKFTTESGEVTSVKLSVIPCSVSGLASYNNYQPIILDDDSTAAKRIYQKLNWSENKNQF